MKSSLAMVVAALTVALGGCDNRTDSAQAPSKVQSNASAAGQATNLTATTMTASATPSVPSNTPDSAPNFAEVYPGAEVEGEPIVAEGSSGQGGVLTFTTEAAPDTVIAFYRQRAEAAGLAPMMALNQGDTRGYGAIRQDTGASVNVVASPVEGTGTSVQLTWSAGQ